MSGNFSYDCVYKCLMFKIYIKYRALEDFKKIKVFTIFSNISKILSFLRR